MSLEESPVIALPSEAPELPPDRHQGTCVSTVLLHGVDRPAHGRVASDRVSWDQGVHAAQACGTCDMHRSPGVSHSAHTLEGAEQDPVPPDLGLKPRFPPQLCSPGVGPEQCTFVPREVWRVDSTIGGRIFLWGKKSWKAPWKLPLPQNAAAFAYNLHAPF